MKVRIQRRGDDGVLHHVTGRRRGADGSWKLVLAEDEKDCRYWRTLAAASWFLSQVGGDLTGIVIFCEAGQAPEKVKASKVEKKVETLAACQEKTTEEQRISEMGNPEQKEALARQMELRKGSGSRAKKAAKIAAKSKPKSELEVVTLID